MIVKRCLDLYDIMTLSQAFCEFTILNTIRSLCSCLAQTPESCVVRYEIVVVIVVIEVMGRYQRGAKCQRKHHRRGVSLDSSAALQSHKVIINGNAHGLNT